MAKRSAADRSTIMIEKHSSSEIQARELLRTAKELADKGLAAELTAETRRSLLETLESLAGQLHCADDTAGAQAGADRGMLAVGVLYAVYGHAFWDSKLKTVHVNHEAASPKCVASQIERIQDDLRNGRALSTYTTPTHKMSNPPTNADLSVLEDYFSICSRGQISFQHSSPGLDQLVSPKTEAVLRSR